MPFTIIRQDITKLKVDAIVNAANTGLRQGGGVCGAIFQAAGKEKLQESCQKLAPIETGEAVITPGFSLPARYIIHAVGPIYHSEQAEQSERLLKNTYTNSLKRAIENNCKSIAFPLISSGIYGYPKEGALQVATKTIQSFLEKHELDVILVVFDKASFQVSQELLGDVASFIDEFYVDKHPEMRKKRSCDEQDRLLLRGVQGRVSEEALIPSSLSEWVDELDEPFSQTLLRLIDDKEKTDVEVYKRANIDRKLFSKIRSSKDYMPSKKTILALAIGLELSLEETDYLLGQAGFVLSHAVKFDVIVEYFILNQKYDIFEINEVLFSYEQPLLGGK
ncbi:MAG TPA: macro domain-containing protein [Candidatus Tetragenococcus pullicola]|nr:macro domain-containing protein [Candidatus Tetragenococcus pullicola]